MNHSPPPKPPPRDDGAFEFELTDFASAREVLDNESIVWAAESARPSDPQDWIAKRRPRVASDRALAGPTIDWLMSLPPSVRPKRLSEEQPRLANQIAAAWSEPDRCLAGIGDLLSDKRGGRRGLPLALRDEVLALQRHLQSRGR